MRLAQERRLPCCASCLIFCLRDAPKFSLLCGLRGVIFLRVLRVILSFLLNCHQSSPAVTDRAGADRGPMIIHTQYAAVRSSHHGQPAGIGTVARGPAVVPWRTVKRQLLGVALGFRLNPRGTTPTGAAAQPADLLSVFIRDHLCSSVVPISCACNRA
jgi:hypothetical protein